jgi:hypothetical protein
VKLITVSFVGVGLDPVWLWADLAQHGGRRADREAQDQPKHVFVAGKTANQQMHSRNNKKYGLRARCHLAESAASQGCQMVYIFSNQTSQFF